MIEETQGDKVVVTGFHRAGEELYGRRMVESFRRYWPDEWKLVVYTEIEHKEIERVEYRRIPEEVEKARSLALAMKGDGKSKQTSYGWKHNEEMNGYSFRLDAYKFCAMAIYTMDAAQRFEGQWLIWLDGDVVTFEKIPSGWMERLIGDEDVDVTYLGREGTHSETGFIAFRLPEARQVAIEWGKSYLNGRVYQYSEWHSAFMFDRTLEAFKGLRTRNMTSKGRGHVWFQSPLGMYMDHLKGEKRKLSGRSGEGI